MSRRSKHIEVSSVALVDLKAEISRRQIDVKKRVEKLPEGCNVIRNHSTGPKITKPTVPSNVKNGDICVDRSSTTPLQDTTEWDRARRALEAKAKLYEALKAAALSGQNCSSLKRLNKQNNGHVFDDDDNDSCLVDFSKKAAETMDGDQTSPANYRNRHSDSDSSDAEESDPASYPPECSDEEWTEYMDDKGVKRVCMRSDLPDLKREPEPKPDGPITYAHLREGEIRDHGVGFYAFSKDAEQREAEMARLRELHRATEEGRARAQAIRAKRDAKMGQRLARLRARKGLPDVATAAAQCLAEASVPSTPQPVSGDAQSDIRLSSEDLDVASMLRRLRDEAEKRAAAQNPVQEQYVPVEQQPLRSNLADIAASQTNIGSKRREWDRGKSLVSAQRYIQDEREKRSSEFAPPPSY